MDTTTIISAFLPYPHEQGRSNDPAIVDKKPINNKD
jgi:hypothetical protein